MFLRNLTNKSAETCSAKLNRLRAALNDADAVIIGAGSGLSAAAGFTYSGERFERYFHDFAKKYHIRDIYSGGFYPFQSLEEYWSWWSRHNWVNRYMDAPKPVYDDLLALVQDKDYFVLTTNVDSELWIVGNAAQRVLFWLICLIACGFITDYSAISLLQAFCISFKMKSRLVDSQVG